MLRKQVQSNDIIVTPGLKKCKFPKKLVEICHGPQVEDNHPFMTLQKKIVFLKTLHSRAWTIAA